MKLPKRKELQGIEYYKARQTFLCKSCLETVIKGKPAVLITYITNPTKLTGWKELDEESIRDGVLLFEDLCTHCGEIFKTTHKIKQSND